MLDLKLLNNSTYGMIGFEVNSIGVEDVIDVEVDKYATFDIKRLTKASSFIASGEVMYIAKKEPNGKSSKIYHCYRVSDKRYVCPLPMSKEDGILLVQRKYVSTNVKDTLF